MKVGKATNLYLELAKVDVLEWLGPLLESHSWLINEDGKVYRRQKFRDIETSWIFHGEHERECELSNIVFHVVSQRMPVLIHGAKPFIPKYCQDCYKVVVRPKNVVQLFALDALMQSMNWPSKCGIEKRDYVSAPYGGYFYVRGPEKAQERLQEVRCMVDSWEYLGSSVKVYSKRACTEMEGFSFKSTPEQESVENLIREYLVYDPVEVSSPEPVRWHTKRRWIEFAAQQGDKSYKLLTAGRELISRG